MRVKRHREHRRNIAFLRTSLGFRPPFKVLCDGNFIHHCKAVGVAQPAASIPKLLGAPTKVYTTRCVIAELQRLGAAVADARLAARKMNLIHCEHSIPAGVPASSDTTTAGEPEPSAAATAGAEDSEYGADEGLISGPGGEPQAEDAAGGEAGLGEAGRAEARGSGAEEKADHDAMDGRPEASSRAKQGRGGKVTAPKSALQSHSRVKGHGVVTVAASECLQQLVAGSNLQHYFVATQDTELCKRLRKLPSTAVIHAKGTAISLLPPSKSQLQTARSSETARRVLPMHEAAQLKQLRAARKKKRLEAAAQGLARDSGDAQMLDSNNDGDAVVREKDVGADDSEKDNELGEEVDERNAVEDATLRSSNPTNANGGESVRVGGTVGKPAHAPGSTAVEVDSDDERGTERKDWRKLGYVKDKARFKKKFVKGPNPLSCKKRTKKAAPAAAPAPEAPLTAAVETKRQGRPRRGRKKQGEAA